MSFNNSIGVSRLAQSPTASWSLYQPRQLNHSATPFVYTPHQTTVASPQYTRPSASMSSQSHGLEVMKANELRRVMWEIDDLLCEVQIPQWEWGTYPTPNPLSIDASESVFLGGLCNENINTPLLYIIGSRFGTVRLIEWSYRNGCAFITFTSTLAAQRALYYLQGLFIFGTNLRSAWDTRPSIWNFDGIKTFYYAEMVNNPRYGPVCVRRSCVYTKNVTADTLDDRGQIGKVKVTDHRPASLPERPASPSYSDFDAAWDPPSPHNQTISNRPLEASSPSSSLASKMVETPPTPAYIELPPPVLPPIGSEMKDVIASKRQYWDQNVGLV